MIVGDGYGDEGENRCKYSRINYSKLEMIVAERHFRTVKKITVTNEK